MSEADKAIKRWAVAHAVADENPSLLLSDTWSQKNSDLCAARMDDLGQAEDAMLAVDDPRIKPYRDAKADSGCGSCWLSSRPRNHRDHHPECMDKIDRYFATRDALVELGLKL